MIAKELDAFSSADKRRKAGHSAEAQLAFYLKRIFEPEHHIRVLNDLRLEHKDDAAQIDHLIIHPYGMVVIESKSVVGTLKINDQGEWLRSYKGHYQGMPSAKLQAERQVLFLRRYLDEDAGQLFDATKGKRATFGAMPIDVLVAISDGGVIHRPKNQQLDYLVKAEQVPDRVTRLIGERRPSGGFLGMFKEGFAFGDGELAGITSFLHNRHSPLEFTGEPRLRAEPAIPVPSVVPPAETVSPNITSHKCKHCQSERLEVRWGQYSYYFKCLDCNENTSISQKCESCGGKEKVRKQGPTFFSECAPCNRSVQFYVNP